MGIKMGIKKTVEVEAKELRIHMKPRDEFYAGLYDSNGEQIGGDYEGYVPDFMPGEHYGDYLILNIDIETGTITNWRKPTAKQLADFIDKGEDE